MSERSSATEQSTMKFEDHLPKSFEFYSDGIVTLDEDLGNLQENFSKFDEILTDSTVSAFRVYSDLETQSHSHVLFVVFDSGLDRDLYSEIGNTIVSQFAGSIGDMDGDLYMISPPTTSNARLLKLQLRANLDQFSIRSYRHVSNSVTVPVYVILFESTVKNETSVPRGNQ